MDKKPLTESDLIVSCDVTLEEFFNGCKKEVVFERMALKGDMQSEYFEVCTRIIEILPGMSSKSEIVFKNEGH